MNRSLYGTFLVLLLVGFVVGTTCVFVVDETEQVVITQFGEPIGQPITQSGLHFKTPIQTTNYFDKRILQWDGDAEELTTLDKRFIWVDAMARWRIVDVLKFMQSVGSQAAAQTLLDDILDGTTRDAISSHALVESIRNSNRLVEMAKTRTLESSALNFDLSESELERIKVGRNKLTDDIFNRSSKAISNYGIELIDVRIKRSNYVKKVQVKVYERMISERKRAAAQFRSEGQGKKAEIEGKMEKELKSIRSEAYRTAQEIKGKADAEAIKIYAEAYNSDPEFYSFMKTLETYKNTVNSGTVLMMDTNSDFFQYLKGVGHTQ